MNDAPVTPAAAPNRTVDRVLSWLLVGVLAVGVMLLGFFSLFSAFATDSCGLTSEPEPRICDSDFLGVLMIGYWLALIASLVGAALGVAIATVRGRRSWPWPVAGIATALSATGAFIALLFA